MSPWVKSSFDSQRLPTTVRASAIRNGRHQVGDPLADEAPGAHIAG